jgi:hypothetical protein
MLTVKELTEDQKADYSRYMASVMSHPNASIEELAYHTGLNVGTLFRAKSLTVDGVMGWANTRFVVDMATSLKTSGTEKEGIIPSHLDWLKDVRSVQSSKVKQLMSKFYGHSTEDTDPPARSKTLGEIVDNMGDLLSELLFLEDALTLDQILTWLNRHVLNDTDKARVTAAIWGTS